MGKLPPFSDPRQAEKLAQRTRKHLSQRHTGVQDAVRLVRFTFRALATSTATLKKPFRLEPRGTATGILQTSWECDAFVLMNVERQGWRVDDARPRTG